MRLMKTTPPRPATYDRTIPVGRLRGEWGEVLAHSCNDTLTSDKHQLISRTGNPQAMVVSTGWYREARRAIGGPDAEVTGSEEARKELARILTEIAEHGRHFVIKADRYEVVVLVPISWHQRALETLSPEGEGSAEGEG
ncbi:hypothetical protein ABZ502_17735 [Streptomyces abikoensis]|uniref:hypothetical protein n=1 Tax=Streptomyces abikoensis TaxID=97398 RepID=UPI00340C45F4